MPNASAIVPDAVRFLMELAHWFMVQVSVLPDGSVSVGHGAVPRSSPTRAACGSALWIDFDRGHSAGYVAHEHEGGLQLMLARGRAREVMQCLSPWTSRQGG